MLRGHAHCARKAYSKQKRKATRRSANAIATMRACARAFVRAPQHVRECQPSRGLVNQTRPHLRPSMRLRTITTSPYVPRPAVCPTMTRSVRWQSRGLSLSDGIARAIEGDNTPRPFPWVSPSTRIVHVNKEGALLQFAGWKCTQQRVHS